MCVVKVFSLLPSLVAHTPSMAGAALFPHFNHAGKSLDTRLTAPQHGHLLVSTNIWPVHRKNTKPERDGQIYTYTLL